MQKIDWYRGKKVFVTGGSSGIGKEAAKMLAASGAHVWIAARGEERLAETEQLLRELAPGGESQRFGHSAIDISDKAQVEAVIPQVLDGLGGLDVLINNAGIAHPAAAMDTPGSIYESMMDVNYFGMVHTTRALLPHFMQQRRGNIANVSSLLGFMGIYGYTAYAASKFAMVGFSECLRQELLAYNVKVSVLFPPDTDTPQLHEENRIKPEQTKAVAGKVKMLPADDVAECLLRGVAKGRLYILPSFDSKFTHFMYRHFPWLVRWIIDRPLRKYSD